MQLLTFTQIIAFLAMGINAVPTPADSTTTLQAREVEQFDEALLAGADAFDSGVEIRDVKDKLEPRYDDQNKPSYQCGYCGAYKWSMPDLTAHTAHKHPGKPVKVHKWHF